MSEWKNQCVDLFGGVEAKKDLIKRSWKSWRGTDPNAIFEHTKKQQNPILYNPHTPVCVKTHRKQALDPTKWPPVAICYFWLNSLLPRRIIHTIWTLCNPMTSSHWFHFFVFHQMLTTTDGWHCCKYSKHWLSSTMSWFWHQIGRVMEYNWLSWTFSINGRWFTISAINFSYAPTPKQFYSRY